MSSSLSRLEQLREASPKDALRLVFRKAIYRQVFIGEFGVRAGDSTAPAHSHDLVIEFLDRDYWDEALENNPYLSRRDLERFRNQEATCIIAREGDRIAASTWMLRGEAYVDELFRTIQLPESQHFSCRSFVAPDYRGMALMGHMVHHYSGSIDQDHIVWGPIFHWNIASIRTFERIGWRHRGDYWTIFLFGRKIHREQHFAAPRPPITLSDSELT